jgi:potassium-dependent mechanosensitive channel
MIHTGHCMYRILGFLVILVLCGAAGLEARQAAPAAPEALPAVLAEANARLQAESISLREKLKSSQVTLARAAAETEELRAKVAALNVAMALKELSLAGAQEELQDLGKRAAVIETRITELRGEREDLSRQVREQAESLAAIKQQVAELESARHPILRARELGQAYRRYQSTAQEFAALANKYDEVLERILQSRQAQGQLVTETRTHIETDYLEKARKEEFLKRQSLVDRIEKFSHILQTLAALPGKARGWLERAAQSGALLLFVEKNWANLAGLFLFLLLLGVGTRRLRELEAPVLDVWELQVTELGLKTLLCFLSLLLAHIFSLGFAAWLFVAMWTLSVINTTAGWLTFYLVATLVALRLAIKMIHSLFAGEAAGGILPVPADLAGFFRRHLKWLAAYFFLVGVFAIPNARYLGLTPDAAADFRTVFQVVLLAWVLWLIRRRPLNRLLAALPVPAFLKSKAFLRTLRAVAFLAFGFIVISGLLGFRYLSDYAAEAASFTVTLLVLAWLLGQGANALLRLTLHPEVGSLAQKHPGRERLFAKLYRSLSRVAAIALAGVAVLVTLRVWGIDFSRVVWVLQWFTWGPALGPIKLTPLNIALTILVVYLGFMVSRLMLTFLELRFYPRTDWDPGIHYTISTTTHYVILVVTILIALSTMGISFTSLALVAGGLGVGIGFGLQNIASNFVSGLILLFERPIKVGDMLIVDGQWGMVREIRIRSTIFQTFDRYVLIIPNSELLSSKILNWTHFGWGLNRLTLKVGVSYSSDPRRVTQIIEEVCLANPRVVKEPPPQIFFEAYGDSSLDFNIWVFLSTPSDRIRTTHELNSAIFEAFQVHGIEIPFPQRDLHIRTWSPEAYPPGSIATTKE